jgi:hypothetical protein
MPTLITSKYSVLRIRKYVEGIYCGLIWRRLNISNCLETRSKITKTWFWIGGLTPNFETGFLQIKVKSHSFFYQLSCTTLWFFTHTLVLAVTRFGVINTIFREMQSNCSSFTKHQICILFETCFFLFVHKYTSAHYNKNVRINIWCCCESIAVGLRLLED